MDRRYRTVSIGTFIHLLLFTKNTTEKTDLNSRRTKLSLFIHFFFFDDSEIREPFSNSVYFIYYRRTLYQNFRFVLEFFQFLQLHLQLKNLPHQKLEDADTGNKHGICSIDLIYFGISSSCDQISMLFLN